MRIFTCAQCNNTVFFENVRCIHCNATLAYFPEQRMVSAIVPVQPTAAAPAQPAAKGQPAAPPPPNGQAQPAPPPSGQAQPAPLYEAAAKSIKGQYRLCANSLAYGVCNSAVRAEDPEPLCEACRLNDVVPDLSDQGAHDAWQSLERAKRRLLFSLHELGLPVESRVERPQNGLQFNFMKDQPDGTKVFTGHSDGLITINIAEADDPLREKLRKQLGEGYRTVLGHFRHEVGHYYWDRLVKDSPWLAPCRALFGDESIDYGEAVKRHYAQGSPPDWPQHYVSSYATMHPWEDWAETWAHYMHLVDTLETADTYGLVLKPKPVGGRTTETVSVRNIDFEDFDELLSAWIPVTVALNSLNRSMGIIDPYPFVLCDDVIAKLRFVHDLVMLWNADEAKQKATIDAWLKRAAQTQPQNQPQQQPAQPAAVAKPADARGTTQAAAQPVS
ncbi:MAG: putative zinc-binding metallopeptidase [Polyangiales bacterium]